MFKKFLARFGKGAAAVDLRFANRPYLAGDLLEGEVHILGGEVEQKVNSLAVRLMLSIRAKQGSAVRDVETIPLSGAFVIMPKEQKVIPFTYQIPSNLPVSRGAISYYFDTQLDIDGGVDRTDIDYFTLDVPNEVQMIFNALGNLGFREKHTSGKVDQYGQEFSFFPTQLFAGQVNEVELRLAHEGSGVRVWMEVDCRNGLHEIEAKREFFIEQSLLDSESQVTELLKESIAEAVNHPHAYAHPLSFTSYRPHHSHGHHGSGIGGMVGGMAMGILGGVLIGELMDDLIGDELLEGAAEDLGLDAAEQGEDDGFDLGDFFGGDDEF
ncbi:sporulation protein [Bacillus benzoevorans]|uniref:Sporulation-control protein n=1 Tax=Bacillus benzoevorans TaxID=1456 RepID=A0A7X0HV50_9BACI|nr:sporulation protein [Bacillus benzoevorans]MBB6446136.1 sporulation-control protein [Bacillus benzoevorans]